MNDHDLIIRKHEYRKYPGSLEPTERLGWSARDEQKRWIRQEIRRNKILTVSIEALLRGGWIVKKEKNDYGQYTFEITQKSKDRLLELKPQDFKSKSSTIQAISTAFMTETLNLRYPRERGWLMFSEVQMGEPFEWRPGKMAYKNMRRIDLLFVNYWHSKKYERIAIEMKRARADLMNELKQPEKRRPIMAQVNYFYFATPVGIVKPNELPDNTGLIEIDENGICRMKKRAPHLGDPAPTWYLMGNIIRRVFDKELDREVMDEDIQTTEAD